MESFKLLYWHWLVFGMVLMLLELVVPSFTILWFGLGGLVVGLLLLVFDGLPLVWQIFLWVVASCGFVLFWFKVLKPRMADRTHAGISREAVLGESGMVVRTPQEGRRGAMRFAVPVLGADTWEFICGESVEIGDRVMVCEFSGNTMVVKKVGRNVPATESAKEA